jgi:hypothetical protein
MNSELLKTVYTYAVIVLAAVAVWHLVNRKGKGGSCGSGSPADDVEPFRWSRRTARGPRIANHHNRSAFGF